MDFINVDPSQPMAPAPAIPADPAEVKLEAEFLHQGDGDEEVAADAALELPTKRRRSVGGPTPKKDVPKSKDLRTFFNAAGTGSAQQAAPIEEARWSEVHDEVAKEVEEQGSKASRGDENLMLKMLKVSVCSVQDLPLGCLEECSPQEGYAETAARTLMLSELVSLRYLADRVPVLVAPAPLLPHGMALLAKLPAQWLDFTGRIDSWGTRCLFASRRHEHSVFRALSPEKLFQVPLKAREWQRPFEVPKVTPNTKDLEGQEPWSVQLHPGEKAIRVVVQPGALLWKVLRRGTAIPSARFTWRITDATSSDARLGLERPRNSSPMGEFSLISNVEDAAFTQPPHFEEWPLRIEQLRSLGWMVSQEQRRREPFVTELRDTAACPDAPHWRLEGSLRCEYTGVKGGVLADAIGYGKTACTIGLVDCTLKHALPRVPSGYAGFIPSRATLVLAPTNLHSQWLAEITKFTGKTMKVISVPTCSQLKRLTVKELVEADIVVSTYRLFYSTPYLKRLQEVARTKMPDFSFPRFAKPPGSAAGAGGHSSANKHLSKTTVEWAAAYRKAFESLPAWAARLHHRVEDNILREIAEETPAKVKREVEQGVVTPTVQGPEDKKGGRRIRGKAAKETADEAPSPAAPAAPEAAEPSAAKRRRVSCKQQDMDHLLSLNQSGTQYIPLEAFWWRRVVCDEFHELLSRYPPAQVAVELFHADYKWGLSGTPPCQTLAQIRKAAGFLGVQLPATETDDGEAPRQVAQEWLDAFVRRNTSELPPLEEEERIVPVQQTAKERVLYQALTQQHVADTQAAAAETEMSDLLEELPEVQAARRSASGLLKLCSHFAPSGAADVVTAEDECERQVNLRRKRVADIRKEAKTLAEKATVTAQLVRHFEPHFGRQPVAQDYAFLKKEGKPALSARLRFLGLPTTGSKAELLERLLGPEGAGAASEAAKATVLRVDFKDLSKGGKARAAPAPEEPPAWTKLEAAVEAPADPAPEASRGRALLVEVAREARGKFGAGAAKAGKVSVNPRCKHVRKSLGMPAWAGVPGTGDFNEDLQEEQWQWLSEKANADRLNKVLDAWKAEAEKFASELLALEPEAAAAVLALSSFQKTLHASQVEVDAAECDVVGESALSFAKYGSKIEAFVKHLQRLAKEDPTNKVICFVQWEDLKRKIGSALEEFGIEHLSLSGSVWHRRTALTRFQHEADSPKLLLLSLEESASGTNLTAANHVIIMHPMDAATKEEAVAFEMQAVGRVRRPGQLRKIHIWRFVTMGTIEQQITEEHQQELWERQRAKIEISQVGPIDGEDLDSDHFEEEDDAAAVKGRAADGLEEHAGLPDVGADMATQVYMGCTAALQELEAVDGEPAKDPAGAETAAMEADAPMDAEAAAMDADVPMDEAAADETLAYADVAPGQASAKETLAYDLSTQVYMGQEMPGQAASTGAPSVAAGMDDAVAQETLAYEDAATQAFPGRAGLEHTAVADAVGGGANSLGAPSKGFVDLEPRGQATQDMGDTSAFVQDADADMATQYYMR